MCGSLRVGGFVARFRQGVCEVTILRGGGERAYGSWIWRRRNGVQETHVADVVDVDFLFQDDHHSFAVETDGEDGRGEGELADDGRSLRVLYDQVPRREDEGDERGREEHLDDANVAVIAAEDAGEGIGVKDAEALGCACGPA